ncbi:RNA-directed DNA polymerase, eukaryota [Tanacetum coccineum]
MFEGDVVEMNFNQGKINEIISENKKKIGRRSVKQAKEVARKTGVEGLGENKKGVSDAYKEYYEAKRESNEVFHFAEAKEKEKECGSRGIKVDVMCLQFNRRNRMEGIGESGKKGWIRSIIKDERPDVIGIQETKCGVVDDIWPEDIWGRQGYGFAQLPIIGLLVYGTDGMVSIKEMTEFNEFMNDMRLLEILMGGRKFTRRFRVFNVWMDEPDFMGVVDEAWKKEECVRSIRGRVTRDLDELVGLLQTVVVHSNCKDNWRWLLGKDGEFTVKDLARLVEEKTIHVEIRGHETLWN